MINENPRRNFLKYSTMLTLGLSADPFSSIANSLNAKFEAPENESMVDIEISSTETLITILQTTDVHCQLHEHDELFWEDDKMVFRKTGGYPRLATYFKKVRAENPNTFILDTGDMFQGSQLSVATKGKALQPILNSMDYDLYLPGNWEVVFYKEQMQKLLGGLNSPKICANMYHEKEGKEKGELIFPPYFIWSTNGIKIGFVGYTDPLVPQRQSPAYSKGIIYTKPEENLPFYVKVLREQEQCSVVILLSHLGLSQQLALANNPVCEGIDYIFGGDTHERVRKPIQCKYSKVVEPGAFGSFVGRLDLVYDGTQLVRQKYSLVEMDSRKLVADKSIHDRLLAIEKPFMKEMNEVLGYSKVPLYRYFVIENTIDTLIIDALKWRVGTDIALSNGFRFCPPRVEKDASGNIPITESYLFDMLPVDSRLRTGKVTGTQILDWLEKELSNVFAQDASKRIGGWVIKFKGMKVEFNAFADLGKRVKQVLIADKPIEPFKLYSVCACEREGDPENVLCRLTNVADASNSQYTLHEAVKQYLKKHSPVSPLPEMNAIILDADSKMLTQVTGVDYKFI
jgi:S-sulfosulfanyl-L-cysteine sulfohydrolase